MNISFKHNWHKNSGNKINMKSITKNEHRRRSNRVQSIAKATILSSEMWRTPQHDECRCGQRTETKQCSDNIIYHWTQQFINELSEILIYLRIRFTCSILCINCLQQHKQAESKLLSVQRYENRSIITSLHSCKHISWAKCACEYTSTTNINLRIKMLSANTAKHTKHTSYKI